MTERIDILVSAQNRTGGAFNSVKQDLQGLDNVAANLSRGLSGIGAIAGAGAIVAGLQAIGAEMVELARRGAIFEQLGSVLEDYTATVGSSAQAFVEAGRKASAGTIADYDLILNANRALQFEVAKSSDQYAKLIELATALGRAQGISDSQALEFLTTGIARESRLILDNLGLIVDLDSATSAYAATIGKAAGDLTQAERKQAILNEAYRQGATALEANRDASDSAATNFERMDASIQNAKDVLGELFSPAVAAVAQAIATAATAATEGMKALNESFDYQAAINDLETVRGKIEGIERSLADREVNVAIIREEQGGELTPEQQKNFESDQEKDTWDLVKAKRELVQVENEYFDALRRGYPSQVQSADAMNRTSVEAEAMSGAAARFSELEAAQRRGEAQSQRTGAALQDLYAALENATPAVKRLAHEMLEGGYGVDEVTDKVRTLRGELNLLASAGAGTRSAIIRAAAGVAGIIGDEAALNLAKKKTEDLDAAIAGLTQQKLDGSITDLELAYTTARLNDEFTATFDAITEADRAAKQFAKEGMADAERSAKKAASEIEQAFEKLKGTVSGVLSEALNVDVGVDVNALLKDGVKVPEGAQPKPEDFLLPREDDVNEAARRLADVAVNGWKSPWIEYLQTAFPELLGDAFAPGQDIRKNAALLLRDFEAGLQPELLDKDKAKERVKRILLGEANMAQLAQEIAAELSAEFGGSISLGKIQATAQAALGVDDGGVQLAQTLTGAASDASGQAAVIGGNIRGGIISALDGIGEAVATTIDKQFRAENNLKVVAAAGQVNGEAWGSGFLVAMDTLTGQVLEKLASLVAPYVEATQARNATLNGAN